MESTTDTINNYYARMLDNNTGHITIKHLPVIQEIIDTVQPQNILEIGYNCGHSAVMWLVLSQAKLVSCDIDLGHNSEFLSQEFPERFTFYLKGSQEIYDLVKDIKFDLIFVDGDHSELGIGLDLLLAHKLRIKYILVDDYVHVVKEVVDKFIQHYPQYEVVKVYPIKEEICQILLKRTDEDA